jgi:death-on-curing protein
VSWIWVPPHLAVAWHEQLIARFGGAAGLRDAGLLESALDRPKNYALYQSDADVFALAALYGVAVAKAHAFLDGNKRIAFAVMVAFLKVHRQALDVSEAEATRMMLDVAASVVREEELAVWLMAQCRGA